MKITELEVRNIMRISYARVHPNEHMTVIGGENGSGKSSLLDAVCMTLGGAKLAMSKRKKKKHPRQGRAECIPTRSDILQRASQVRSKWTEKIRRNRSWSKDKTYEVQTMPSWVREEENDNA